MIKRFFIILVMIIPVGLPLKAQQTVGIGGGLFYSTPLKMTGVNLRGVYFISYHLNVAGELNYFLPRASAPSTLQRTSRIEFAMNLRYRFDLKGKWFVYPLAGISWILQRQITPDIEQKSITKRKEGGLNLGVGSGYDFGRFVPFIEYRYVASGIYQSEWMVGVVIKDFLNK